MTKKSKLQKTWEGPVKQAIKDAESAERLPKETKDWIKGLSDKDLDFVTYVAVARNNNWPLVSALIEEQIERFAKGRRKR